MHQGHLLHTFIKHGIISWRGSEIRGHLLYFHPVDVEFVDSLLHMDWYVCAHLPTADRQIPVRLVQTVHVSLSGPERFLHCLHLME